MKPKFIVVTGGVLSGLGKGVTTSSIGNLLKAQGYNVTALKMDPYINVDAGTMRPTEHGEVWVTDDGGETDQDLGNYERFIDITLSKKHSITTGQLYLTVIQKERNLEYDGKCVEVIPHIPLEIKRRILDVANTTKADFVLIEVGGTVGDYQSILFLEALRELKREVKDLIFVHVVYLPIPNNLGEMKTKPAQHSIRFLNSTGIQPDYIIARASRTIDKVRREKFSFLCNVEDDAVFAAPDVKNIYEVPLLFERQGLDKKILSHFGLRYKSNNNRVWKSFIHKLSLLKNEVKIGVVGKYFDIGDFTLEDSYVSVIEAIKHASWANNVIPKIQWIDSKQFETNPKSITQLSQYDALIIPGGFGGSGVEGKITAIKYARENNIPLLGLCYGLQLSVVEFARNVCNVKDAHTTEINPNTKNPVVIILPEQKKLLEQKQYGASMRLGSYNAILKKNTKVAQLYKKNEASERHRHRYEVNPDYHQLLEQHGMILSGMSPDGKLVEYIELPNHPYFVGTQAHPEFTSRPLHPNPLFYGLIEAAKKRAKRSSL
ncbi:CTP synthase [Candidatus Woesearchaeota archaeon]|nr:CTP synthase [Candidatus Woesearchaeota archaeon]